MVNLADMAELKQAARVVKDENGQAVVQVPLDVWEAVVGTVEEKLPDAKPEMSQVARIKALLKSWENEPDDKSPEWWDEFDQFLKDNPVKLGDPDAIPGDE